MFENAVLITGAGQRVGFEIAKQFIATQDFPVLFSYRTERQEVAELKALGAVGFQVDFTQQDSFDKFCENINEQVSSLRLLVHNASIWQKDAELTTTQFNEMFLLHQLIPYSLTLHLEKQLLSNSIVADVIAISDCKIATGHADYAAYLSTKAGLATLMDSFAKKFAPNIKVNTVATGLVMFNKDDSADYRANRLSQMALPIEPGAEVIWNAIQFLMNSQNATGSTVELGQLTN